jgi:hypothetical protein
MNKPLLLKALLLIGWLGVGGWSIAKLLEPAYLLDILKLFSMC